MSRLNWARLQLLIVTVFFLLYAWYIIGTHVECRPYGKAEASTALRILCLEYMKE